MFDEKQYYEYLKDLVSINSPSGYPMEMNKYIFNELEKIFGEDYFGGISHDLFNNKMKKKSYFAKKNNGENYVFINGKNHNELTVFLVHTDKVGLIVKSIKSDGSLVLNKIGGIDGDFLNGVFGTIQTRINNKIKGTIYSSSKSDKHSITFVPDMEDNNKQNILDNHILVGDFVFPDNHISNSRWYFKSRYLDNSVSVAIALSLINFLITKSKQPRNSLLFVFSEHEEMGCKTTLPTDFDEQLKNKIIKEVVALDVGDVNENVSEEEVCILAKDSYCNYDYESVNKLLKISKEFNIDVAVDVCEGGTDASTYKINGMDSKIISFGPAIDNMHGVERINKQAVLNMYTLLCIFIAE